MLEVVVLVFIVADIERLLGDEGWDVFVGFFVCCGGRIWLAGLRSGWRHFGRNLRAMGVVEGQVAVRRKIVS